MLLLLLLLLLLLVVVVVVVVVVVMVVVVVVVVVETSLSPRRGILKRLLPSPNHRFATWEAALVRKWPSSPVPREQLSLLPRAQINASSSSPLGAKGPRVQQLSRLRRANRKVSSVSPLIAEAVFTNAGRRTLAGSALDKRVGDFGPSSALYLL